ncbi:hypothetical protein G7076_07225 [Sphingomonas sp. HDW15A]|uniref:DUF3617 domain-containing protein n=1 Tax=Sphingomonas sp. HDW15A TaxID=2714942 RepID=UPI00140BBE97|nr:DUF3617 family protein [Sphingomonas sp. HDW15A]QIK96265.1 hypothetical protein G7076_07225 [Sphingomonas sp. HDW15A]
MMRFALPFRFLAIVPAAFAAGAASLPSALSGSGEWQVSTNATGTGGSRHCLADAAILTQWEHRRAQCTRVVLTGTQDRADVQYSCSNGGFGNSKVHVLTPRSVRIETQGIADGLPFGYTIHARRTGNCPVVKR